MEDIEGKHRLGAWVLLAENKVNPPTQLTRHKLAFQALSEEGRAIREREEHTTHNTHNRTIPDRHNTKDSFSSEEGDQHSVDEN